jgi:hypothetical protein
MSEIINWRTDWQEAGYFGDDRSSGKKLKNEKLA